MSTICLSNNNLNARLSSSSSFKADALVSHSIKSTLSAITGFKQRASKNTALSIKLDSSFNLLPKETSTLRISKFLYTDNSSINAFALVSGVINARVSSDSSFKVKNVDKFGGITSSIINFNAQEKLYPRSDFNVVDFTDENDNTNNLYESINEGIFVGEYFANDKQSEIISDNTSYIEPYSLIGSGEFSYRFGVTPLNTKAEDSFFAIRALAPMINHAVRIPAKYNFKNIKLLDPSGDLIIRYKDFSIRGDNHYATYVTEPDLNYARLNTYHPNYPRIGNEYAIGNSGYSVSFDLDVLCLDDPFNQGFDDGYQEFLCDDTNDETPADHIRITAIEILNSGSLNPVLQNRLNINILPPSKGQRIVRHIFPTSILSSGYDTTIAPFVESRWRSSAYPDNSNVFENSGIKSASFLSDRNLPTYFTLEDSSIPDSGKLILKFQDKPQSYTLIKVIGSFDGAFGIGYNITKNQSFPLQDTFYADIDEIYLKVTARKKEGMDDFSLDVVGYSDDRLLAVTSPSGGFLQTLNGEGSIPNDLGDDDDPSINRSLSSGPLSDGGNFNLLQNSVLNNGGDHYLLTKTPVINSTYFKDYTIPLKIYDLVPQVGRIKRYNQSTYFENLYVDIYPIPSGADIAEVRLEVYYRPGNAIPMTIVGQPVDKTLVRNSFKLGIERDNNSYNLGELSSFDNLPHGFETPENIKTNYSRRWRGVAGKAYNSAFGSVFGFDFDKDELRDPYKAGSYDFAEISGNYVVSKHEEYPASGLFVGNLESSLYNTTGWRFKNPDIVTTSSQNYATTDWTSGNHPLSGKIADAFANAIRVSGEDGYLIFNDLNTDNFSIFIRFTPDETVSGVSYNQFDSGILFSKDQDFGLRYNNGYLQAYINTSTGEVNATDDIFYTEYSYPLSVVVTYDGSNLLLHTDNELESENFDILRASANGVKTNTSNNLLIGTNINMFVADLGLSSGSIPTYSDQVLSVEDTFNSIRMVFGEATSYRNNLWSYIDQDPNEVWDLREFKTCEFNHEFNRLRKRIDVDYIEHKVVNDGSPYVDKVDIDTPNNLLLSNVCYHTQVENDFIRFNIADVPDVEGSGAFYVSDLRINKNLPRGYKFNEQAIAVETVIDSDSSVDIEAKLIVSLYSPTLIPEYITDKPNYGLINRHIHTISTNDCYNKLISVFDYNNLFNNSEPWADFERDAYLKEFDHKYYSDDINQMFLQYDIVYPEHSGDFKSRIRVHSVDIGINKSLIEIPTATDEINIFSSGDFSYLDYVDCFILGHESVGQSGLTISVSGGPPDSLFDSGILYVSGDTFITEELNLHTIAYNTVDTSNQNFGSFGDSPIIGLQMFVGNSGNFESKAGMNLTAFNVDSVPTSENGLNFTLYSSEFRIYQSTDSFNMIMRAPRFNYIDNLVSSNMPMFTKLTNKFLAYHLNPFNLVINVDPGIHNDDLNLYTVTNSEIDVDTGEIQSIQWNGKNPGTDILITDNGYSALAANDEIRGVVTICYGDCDYTGTCSTREIYTHGNYWNEEQCIDGGIARAESTYTNSNTVAFNTDPSGYDSHYYGIRKLTGLIPSYPYSVTIKGYSGSTEPIELPKIIDTVEYGASEEVNFSGVKHFYDDPQSLHAQYGKDIVIRGDLMAIGAPNYTLVDASGNIEDAGAVFLYRRLPQPSGYDWSDQDDKSGWQLEDILTLPDGFKRDYSYQSTGLVGVDDNTYPANIRKWVVGQYGRNFGYSVEIVHDQENPNNDIIIVGAPKAKFNRSFGELVVKDINMLFLIITDNLDLPDTSVTSQILSFIEDRNKFFSYVATPGFRINPTFFILSATANVKSIEDQIGDSFPGFISGTINRITSVENGEAQSLSIEQQLKDIFNQNFPLQEGVDNSGIPAMVGVFVDNSSSLGREAISPALDNFLAYYKEFSYASGLTNYTNIEPISGVVKEYNLNLPTEDWENAASELATSILQDDVIESNINLFTETYDLSNVPDDVRFNEIPTSGGRVYIFEKELAQSGLFYDNETTIWNITQEIGHDKYEYNTNYPYDRFGHDVAASRDGSKIAIGSPYCKPTGVIVYEKNDNYDKRYLYNSVGSWLFKRAEENQDDVTSVYHTLYTQYQEEESVGGELYAGKIIYDTLNPSGRFDLRFYNESVFKVEPNRYRQVFAYHNDYNFQGTWQFAAKFFASPPRVGYSVALSEDGNILAVGCPTDSMNQFDDSNVYHRNTRICDEDPVTPGYNSDLPEESHLVTGEWNSNGVEGTLQSYVNAGAVQLFDSRRYYPHNKIVEYGIFGNKHRALADPEDRDQYYDLFSGIFYNNREFVRTPFADPEIPEDAGVLIINTPEIDSLSEEVLENIEKWLELGDRNLVLVGDDPSWEFNGAFKYSNDILNKILDRLGSRVRLYSARNTYHALSNPGNDINIIPATRPEKSDDIYITTPNMIASGVADIRFYDPSLPTFSHDCGPDYYTANIGCNPDIKHEGDLRSQWYAWCESASGKRYRVPRNIKAAYGVIPGLIDTQCLLGSPCEENCEWEANEDNINKTPVPILAAAEPQPPILQVIKGTPAQTGVIQVGVETVVSGKKRGLGGTDFNNPVFYINSSGNSYSGVYENFDTNYRNFAPVEGEFFKPESLDIDFMVQSSGISTTRSSREYEVISDLPYLCAETTYSTPAGKEDSSVVLLANVAAESDDVLNLGDNDQMVYFYKNIISKGLSLSTEDVTLPNGSLKQVEISRVAQLGGWTKRTSFRDGYSESSLFYTDGNNTTGLFKINSLFNGLRSGSIKTYVDLNVDPATELEFGRTKNYDVCWIANTSTAPSDEDVQLIKSWLKQGNKRLIITYAHNPELNNPDLMVPSQTNADAAYILCDKLGIDIKPLFVTSKGRYAEYGKDYGFVEVPQEFPNDDLSGDFNDVSIFNENLPSKFTFSLNTPGRSSLKDRSIFIPIQTSRNNYVVFYRYPYNNNALDNIIDSYPITETFYYLNPGFAKLDVQFPDIDNSGCFLKIGFATRSELERNRNVTIVLDGIASKRTVFGQEIFSTADADVYDANRDRHNLFSGIGTLEIRNISNPDKVLDIGPLWVTKENPAIYISTYDMQLKNEFLMSPRLTFVSGYPVEISETLTYENIPIYETVVIPGTPDKIINIAGDIREISTTHDRYCPSLDGDCLDVFNIPYNDREGVEDPLADPLAKASGQKYTVDGPVVVSQEYYLGGNFSAGVTRSKITVISDSSLIQGKLAYDEFGNKKRENTWFVSSLYPEINFPDDTIYNIRTKITAPERGSPYKWFSATGNESLIERFMYNNIAVSPLDADKFTGDESNFDPKYVARPKEKPCEDEIFGFDVEKWKNEYVSGIQSSLSPFSQFSTTFNGKKYKDDYKLVKETSYDYLDFDIFKDGYPGDLFGFSVAINNNKLVVGSPFTAFSQQDKIVAWSDISNTPSGQIPSGVKLSSYGGAGAVYLFEKNLNGGEYIKNYKNSFVREGNTDWAYVRKFRPDSINIGQDLTSVITANSSIYIGENTYSPDDIEELTKQTDKFGYSVAIDSGIIAIGAPGHDFNNFVDDGQTTGIFMNKAFNQAFVTPDRHVYDLGTSGIRNIYYDQTITTGESGIKFGGSILNNGAVYVYSEDYDFSSDTYQWHILEKIVPQGNNSHRQKKYIGAQEIPVSGSENSQFGLSVSVSRFSRSDSDYVIGVGSPYHPFSSGTDLEEYKRNKGSSYTYDLILRLQPPALADSGAFINAKLFAESGNNLLREPILLSIINSGLNSYEFENTGIIYSNRNGDIFLEVSGQDLSTYKYINHRPFIHSVEGYMIPGIREADSFGMFIEGRPYEAFSSGFPLSISVENSANVYNEIGMFTYGITDYAQESGLTLFSRVDNPSQIFDSTTLYTSGSWSSGDSLYITTRGF